MSDPFPKLSSELSPELSEEFSAKLRYLSVLDPTINALHSTLELEKRLRIILKCVTAGQALGFNRAFLFLSDENQEYLEGKMAVGPTSLEEAHRIWYDLDLNEKTLENILAETDGVAPNWNDDLLTQLVRQVRLPLKGDFSLSISDAVHHREAVLIGKDKDYDSCNVETLQLNPSTTFAVAPLLVGEKILGVILADNLYNHRDITRDHLELLGTFAKHVSAAIHNAMVYSDANRRISEFNVLQSIGEIILSTLDLSAELDLIAQTTVQAIGAKGCIVRLVEEEDSILRIKGSWGLNDDMIETGTLLAGEGIAGWVVREGKPALVPDVHSDPRFADITKSVTSSLLCVPLILKGKVIGSITLYDKVPNGGIGIQGFTRKDQEFLSLIANQAAIAIENAKLFESEQKQIDRLGIMLEISNSISSYLELQPMLEKLAEKITALFDTSACDILLLDASNENIDLRAGFVMPMPDQHYRKERRFPKLVPLKELPLTQRLILKKEAVTTETADDPLFLSFEKRWVRSANVKATMGVPLVSRDEAIGCIIVYEMDKSRKFSQEQVSLCQAIANQVAIVIENARLLEKLRETQDVLLRLERLDTLGEVIAHVSHEIRNPLTAIGGLARFIRKSLPPDNDEEQKESIDLIISEVEKLEDILRDQLDFKGVSGTKLEPSNINESVEGALSMIGLAAIRKGVRIERHLSDNLPKVMVDSGQLKQALVNLFQNAIDAMSEGNTFIISTGKTEAQLEIGVSSTAVNAPKDLVENLFKPFFISGIERSGRNLNLSYRIIRSQGGDIMVRTEEGKGVTFLITFPLHNKERIDYGYSLSS